MTDYNKAVNFALEARKILVTNKYRHYKNQKVYEIIDIAVKVNSKSDDLGIDIVYVDENNVTHTREFQDFFDFVDVANDVPRFEAIPR